MRSPFAFIQPIEEFFDGKLQQFMSGIDDVHMVWVQEIQEEARRMLTNEFSAEPEMMPKTPSQKKRSRRKRVSLGHQEETRAKRRLSRTKRSKLRHSSVKLTLITEDECIAQASTSGEVTEQPRPSTPVNNIPQPEESVEPEAAAAVSDTQGSPVVPARDSSTDRSSVELVAEEEVSPGRHATKIAIAGTSGRAGRSSVRHSLKLRYSLAGLRHSIRHDAMRRASRRSVLSKSSARTGSSNCSSKVSDDSCMETDGEVENNGDLPSVGSDAVDMAAEASEATSKEPVDSVRITRSMAVNSPIVVSTPVRASRLRDISSGSARKASVRNQSRRSSKRRSPEVQEDSPAKRLVPPKKSNSVVRPNMRAFLQTVQKNRMLMMTPTSLNRTSVMKSFIKHTTPLKIDPKSRELHKLEALKKKQEQEEERLKKMDEEKRRKQEEQKRKRDERLRRVVEARMKEDEEKKKRIEQKMTQLEEKNDKMRVERLAEEKAKKAAKRQEEADQKRRMEEEARLKKVQQAEEEEEKRQQELVSKRAAEEEEQRTRKMAEARRALELRRQAAERERAERENALAVQRELEMERQAAAERERTEKQKALAVQRELEKAAREKERRELEERRRQIEENIMREERQRIAAERAAREMEAAKQKMALNIVQSSVLKTPVGKCAAMNVTVEVEKSPQSYSITPKGGNRPLVKSKNAEDYGMDQNSDDSTDDESAPRKPIPSWAEGHNLQQVIMKQYFNPLDLHTYFGLIEPPKLEKIFTKSKPRFFKRTSSAVWHSPPRLGKH